MLDDLQPAPLLSIVIVPFVGVKGLRECLSALAGQVTKYQIETIVPYDDRFPDFALIATEYPDVRFYPVTGRKTYAQLRSAGVHAASGEIVAITEDHCRPTADWSENILTAHRGQTGNSITVGGIGGPVDKASPDTNVNWAMYFADYVRYASPVTEGPVNSLTDLNVSYKMSDLEQISGVWMEEFHENEVHTALQSNGKVLWLSPRITVLQKREYTFGKAVQDRYSFGRLFASTRIGLISKGKRIFYTLFSVFVPLLQLVRIVQNVRNKHKWSRELLKALPALVVLVTVWAVGEFMGYVTGRADRSLAAG